MPFFIYALEDPRDGTVFYVGMTSKLEGRLSSHLRCDGTNPAKDEKIKALRTAGHIVIIRTLEAVDTEEKARDRERFWIQEYQKKGIKLVNRVHTNAPAKKNLTSLKNQVLQEKSPREEPAWDRERKLARQLFPLAIPLVHFWYDNAQSVWIAFVCVKRKGRWIRENWRSLEVTLTNQEQAGRELEQLKQFILSKYPGVLIVAHEVIHECERMEIDQLTMRHRQAIEQWKAESLDRIKHLEE